jgi:hypothetical protein
LPLIGLPPIISMLTDMLPILRKGRFPAEDFPAGEGVVILASERELIDAATIDVARVLFKNRRRVSLFDIRVFLAITLHNPQKLSCSACRITYCLGEEHALFGAKLELVPASNVTAGTAFKNVLRFI